MTTDLTVAVDPPYPVRMRATFEDAWHALLSDHVDTKKLVVADNVSITADRIFSLNDPS